ncbi:MAG TPA: D-glycero-beta-D-manno-heptose-7-phosphate kinase [Pyrinomonadaceae bacterium]
MNALTEQRVKEILDAIRTRNIVVLGDVMLDEFVWGDVTRISPEAPIPVVDVQRESVCLGGAANVLANLISLGAQGTVTGVVGHDRAAELLHSSIDQIVSQDGHLIADPSRPTTLKTRIIAHSQPVVRTDRESRSPINSAIEDQVISRLKAALARADAFVVSDYDKGAVTPRILEAVLPVAYARIPVLVDPKMRNFKSYRPATLITPNHFEALRMSNSEEDSDEGLHVAAQRIRAELNCDAVLITRGARGMLLLEGKSDPVYVQTAAREVYDVTGAGDTVIAALAAALSTGASMLEAATFANHAAGIVVGKVGTATVSPDELIATFDS